MVKKANTDKKTKTKTDEYVGVKKTDLQKTTNLVVQQDEMIRQLRNAVQVKDEQLNLVRAQRDTYSNKLDVVNNQLDEVIAKSNQKDTLFYAMTDLCQDANEQCEELDLDLDDARRRAKAFKLGFYAAIAMNVTFAILHLFVC